jgi:hypothetical protein
MKTLDRLLCSLALLVPAPAIADALPKPIADLNRIVGEWRGTGSLRMGKDTAKLTATWSCERTSAEFGVLCKLHVTGIPGVQSYEETDLLGYEPNTQRYHWYSVTNAGETHDHVASVPNGDTFRFVFSGTQEGKPFEEVIDLGFASGSRAVTGKAETFVAGTSTSVMQLSLAK